MRNILALGRTIFIYGSAVGFWYIVIPTHITSMIFTMVSYGILGGIGFLIIGNIFIAFVGMLSRKSKLTKLVFSRQRRW